MGYGPKAIAPGGRALKFYASVRVDLRRIGAIKSGGDASDPIGHKVQANIIKNKVAPPFKKSVFEIYYGTGISHEACLIDIGIQQKIISQKGSWYSYGETRLGNGKINAMDFLKTDGKQLAQEIQSKILGKTIVAPNIEIEEESIESAVAEV